MRWVLGIWAPLALTAGCAGGASAATLPRGPLPAPAPDTFPDRPEGDSPLGQGLPGNGPAPGEGLPEGVPAARPNRQVRIEQSFTIRITPGQARPMPPPLVQELEQSRPLTHFTEQPMGRCVAMGNIAGVQSSEGNRLLLFMRDQHIVSALLEKACRAQDFYLGFYVAGNRDGMICVDRDRLQARSGANCKVKRLRALVETAPRRQP